MTRQVRKKMPARREPAWTRLDDEALLDLRFCDLRLSMARTPLEDSVRRLYGELARVAPSPVVELNRAVAVSMHAGPAAGLVLVDALLKNKALRQYHWLPSVRGDLLARLGRDGEARAEFERAADLAGNEREKAFLMERAAGLSDGA